MIKRVGKDVSVYSRPPWILARSVASSAAATLVLSVALVIPESSADNRTKQSLPAAKGRRSGSASISHWTKGDQAQLLRYDFRSKPPGANLPRRFHDAKDLLSRPVTSEPSNIGSLRSPYPSGICPSAITQSTSQVVVTNSVACSDPGIGTLENHYWRAFNMSTFTGGQAYDVTSVEFGIEQADSLFGTDQPLTVNLYANHGPPFPGGDWQSNLLASSGEIRVPNQEFTIFNVPLTTTVPAGTFELVMEVLSPDQTVEHNFFIIGSNPDPETGPSYLSAPDCGNPDPLPVDCFVGPMHYVFNVNGSCVAGGGTPTPTPTATASPTPSCPPITITGSIDNSDLTQVDRMNRSGVSSCCGGGPGCVIFGDGQLHHYDAYTFTNTTGSTQCVTVGVTTDCQGSNFIFTAAYLGTFDPNNICANWIADEGSSPIPGDPTPFSFTIEDGQTFVLVVSEVSANGGCPSYTMTVSGLCGGEPTPTPTATPTPTSTPTPAARPTPTPRSHPTPRSRPTPPTP